MLLLDNSDRSKNTNIHVQPISSLFARDTHLKNIINVVCYHRTTSSKQTLSSWRCHHSVSGLTLSPPRNPTPDSNLQILAATIYMRNPITISAQRISHREKTLMEKFYRIS